MNFFAKLFETNPGSQFSYYYPIVILSAILIIGSIVASVIYKKRKTYDFAYKRLFKKLSNRLLLIGLLFLLLTGVRYESIPYFSMRIWFYLASLLLLYFAYKYIKTGITEYPKEKENIEHNLKNPNNQKEEKRYLPNKKKRK